MKKGALFVVATPIGNMSDLSDRAVQTLQKADWIAAEDTRHFARIAERFSIFTPKISFHAHSAPEKILEKLREGKTVALVSDAGTPGISDPGTALVSLALSEGHAVCPLPGPTAFVTALCVSGLPTDHFEFFGFLPHKKGRESFFKNLQKCDHTAIFYESTHRIEKCLAQLVAFLPTRPVVVARELTKIHEEFLRGSAEDILAIFQKFPEKMRGEFVVLVGPNHEKERKES